MRVLCGLGNPGAKYRYTRHNVGFLVVDALADKYQIRIDRFKFNSLIGEGNIQKEKVLLVKPLTFMNLAGVAVKEICEALGVDRKALLVINDDADLELGRIKIAQKGKDAGHLGVRSIIESLKDQNFLRLRIGIGRPPEGIQLRDYVLQEFTSKEWELIQSTILRAVGAVETIILQGTEKAMNEYNLQKKE